MINSARTRRRADMRAHARAHAYSHTSRTTFLFKAKTPLEKKGWVQALRGVLEQQLKDMKSKTF